MGRVTDGRVLRCGIYCRVSTTAQSREDRYSRPEQEHENRAYVTEQGWTVDPRFVVHEVVSAFRPIRDRPKLDSLLSALEAGEIDVLLCHDPDRLSRNQVVQALIVDRVDQARRSHPDVRLAFTLFNFEDDATGKFMLSARTFAAELQRERTLEASLRGKRGKAKAGKALGSGEPPFGLQYDPAAGRYAEDPAEIDTLKWMFRSVAAGMSCRAVGLELERRGVLPPYHHRTGSRRWGQTTVRRILGNFKYTGFGEQFTTEWEHLPGLTKRGNPRKRLVSLPPGDSRRMPLATGVYPQVIDAAVFAQVQDQITANRGETQRRDRDPAVGVFRRGFAICGLCGYALVVRQCSRPHLGYHYSCAGCGRNGCGKVSIMTHLLDDPAWSKVEEVLNRPEVIRERLEALRRDDTTRLELELVDRLRARIAQEQAKLARAVAVLDNEDVAAPLLAELANLARQKKSADGERAEILLRRDAGESNRRRLQEAIDFTEEVRRQVRAETESLNWEQKRIVLQQLSVKVKVFPANYQPRWHMTMTWKDDPGESWWRGSIEMSDGWGMDFRSPDRDTEHAVQIVAHPLRGEDAKAATASVRREHSSSVVR